MVVITPEGIQSHYPFPKMKRRFCIFEYVYFARPDSRVEGRSVYDARKRIGAEVARESPVDADVVIPVPDSGVPGGLGYASEARIPFELGIIRNHYVGRTFIQPMQKVRDLGVKLKHNANPEVIDGKRVILVDDSIVRGTTSKKIVEMVRKAGAREVHMRIAGPPTTHSCFYGVDTPERSDLLAARMDVAEMAAFIGVDSLAFVSIDGLYRAVGEPGRRTQPAAILRRLLHRRLPDAAHRFGGRTRPPAFPPRRAVSNSAVAQTFRGRIVLITGASRGIGARRRSPLRGKARTSSPSPARSTTSKPSTTRSRPRAARRASFPST